MMSIKSGSAKTTPIKYYAESIMSIQLRKVWRRRISMEVRESEKRGHCS